jgi:hypothetical protein
MTTTTQKVPCSTTATTRWLVLVDGKEVGLIEKRSSTKASLNPFKAYKGIGFACTYVGSFFDKGEAMKWGMPSNDCTPAEEYRGFEGALAKVVA